MGEVTSLLEFFQVVTDFVTLIVTTHLALALSLSLTVLGTWYFLWNPLTP